MPSIRLLKRSGWLLVETKMRLTACHQERRVKAPASTVETQPTLWTPQSSQICPAQSCPTRETWKNVGKNSNGDFHDTAVTIMSVSSTSIRQYSDYGLLASNIVIAKPWDGLQGARLFLACSLVVSVQVCSHIQGWSLWFCQKSCKSNDGWADKSGLFLNFYFSDASHNYGLCLCMSLALHQLK